MKSSVKFGSLPKVVPIKETVLHVAFGPQRQAAMTTICLLGPSQIGLFGSVAPLWGGGLFCVHSDGFINYADFRSIIASFFHLSLF